MSGWKPWGEAPGYLGRWREDEERGCDELGMNGVVRMEKKTLGCPWLKPLLVVQVFELSKL